MSDLRIQLNDDQYFISVFPYQVIRFDGVIDSMFVNCVITPSILSLLKQYELEYSIIMTRIAGQYELKDTRITHTCVYACFLEFNSVEQFVLAKLII